MNIDRYFIEDSITVKDAMKQLNETASRVLFIQDNGKLLAACTDGDIRRWILSGGELTVSIKNAANYNPKYLINGTYEQAIKYLKQYKIEAIPIVDENLIIKDIIFWNQQEVKKNNESLSLPVVMMAGGKGTRLYPFTKILPKPLIPVGDMPIAEIIMNQFAEYGCKDFHLIVNHKKNMIKAYFNEIEKDYNVYFEDEDIPLGTGGGLSLLKGKINKTFILTNCDIIIQEDMIPIYKFHKEHNNIITMICAAKEVQIPYGVVNVEENGKIVSMEEKPCFSFLTNTGCYIVEPEVIDSLESNKMIGFPDIIEQYKMSGKNVGAYPIDGDKWMDMGQIDELEKMRKRLETQ